MYLFFEDKNNKYNNGEIYGSWNDWSTPIKISDYNYIIDNIKIFKIPTNKKVISYKIKINNEFILFNNLFITNDNGFKNNKIFLTEDDYYKAIENMVNLGFTGGAIYDGLIAYSALKIEVDKILTLRGCLKSIR